MFSIIRSCIIPLFIYSLAVANTDMRLESVNQPVSPDLFGELVDVVTLGYLHWNQESGDVIDPDDDANDIDNNFGEHGGFVDSPEFTTYGSGNVAEEFVYVCGDGTTGWNFAVSGPGEYILVTRLWRELRERTDIVISYNSGDRWIDLPVVDDIQHHRADSPQIKLTTHLIPSSDTLESSVTIVGPNEDAVRSIRRINACWQFRKSDSFGNQGHFVRDFVNRCFIYTDKGFMRMADTKRFPDTRRPPDHEYNSPPWVQRYIPIWKEHPGQPEASWGNSKDRPVYSLVGIVSRDGKSLAAWGCYQCDGIGQGWHDCLHLLPDLSLDYDGEKNRIASRSVFYFMENAPDKLLARYRADFSPVDR
jgi:hypothetical protein